MNIRNLPDRLLIGVICVFLFPFFALGLLGELIGELIITPLSFMAYRAQHRIEGRLNDQ